MGFFQQLGNFFGGTPEKRKRVSTLMPNQQPLLDQAIKAGMGYGAEGALGTAADYHRDILNDDPEKMNQFYAPHLRQYNEEIIPGLSEQFAGMGAGGLSSSGFRNAQVQGATDLSERLGAIRANLRNQSANSLAGIGQVGLGNFSQEVVQPGTPGFLSQLSPAFGAALGSFGGPVAGALGQMGGNWLSRSGKAQTNTSPYGQSEGKWNLGSQGSGWNI